ncbi:hypothetical protein EDD21DRAFT_358259 [Dissophora ornata]|nr:hypothetical protein BGZ58_000608 [Dissophora ornata]KAI8596310.1 hypothetical protein EDD21DRAFT_358259 [Dissophora ornata]
MSSTSPSPSLALQVQPLSSSNRAKVAQLLFDTHMRSVPTTFNFLKLRPMALILWTAISTLILKFRQTHLQNYSEVLTVLSGSVILAQAALFISLLYDATKQASGSQVVGQLENFVDQESSAQEKKAVGAGIKKRSTESSSSTAAAEPESVVPTVKKTAANKDNMFWVLEKHGEPIGSIGTVVDRARGEARLVSWAVLESHQRNGCGTLLLKTAMDHLSKQGISHNKDVKVQTVRVVLQGSQVPALRLFHKFGFKQLDRTPEWLGERVVLEIATKDWGKCSPLIEM